ncbi:GNAT family N-acetyltransferase [Streptomyces decoyicus]|uniref:GNAT family N-acetyltransferase n=1 Tax=Streptomyces decoyicus TaxID=249567 RepID=UPI0038078D72
MLDASLIAAPYWADRTAEAYGPTEQEPRTPLPACNAFAHKRRKSSVLVKELRKVTNGQVVGHIALKRLDAARTMAEIGYWTGPAARGLGVASQAVEMLTAGAFDTDEGEGLAGLELIHNVDNPASCRPVDKTGYALEAVLPPRPPHPLEGHLHARERGAIPSV